MPLALFLPAQSAYPAPLPFLTVLATTSSKAVEWGGKREIGIVLGPGVKASQFSPLGIVLAVGVLQMLFIKLKFSCIPSLLKLFISNGVGFCQARTRLSPSECKQTENQTEGPLIRNVATDTKRG